MMRWDSIQRTVFFFCFMGIFFGFFSLHAEISEYRLMRLLDLISQDLIDLCERDDFKQKKFDDVKGASQDAKNAKIKTTIVEPVEKEVKKIIDKYWHQVSLEHKKLKLQEIIIRLLSKIVVAQVLNKLVFVINSSNKFGAMWCLCPEASSTQRILLILNVLDVVRTNYSPGAKLCITSLATGNVCFFEYLLVSELLYLGYTIETINFIEHYFDEDNTQTDFKLWESVLKEEKQEKEALFLGRSNFSKNFMASAINYYGSAYHYLDACEKNSALKSHITLLVDPNPGLWDLSSDKTQREFNVLNINKGEFYLYIPYNDSPQKIRLYKQNDAPFDEGSFFNTVKSFFKSIVDIKSYGKITDIGVALNKSMSLYTFYLKNFNACEVVLCRADPYVVFFDVMRNAMRDDGIACFIARNKFGWATKHDIVSPWEYEVPEPLTNKFDLYLKQDGDDVLPNDFRFILASDFCSGFKADYEKARENACARAIQKRLNFLKEGLLLLSEQVKKLRDALVAVSSKLETLAQKFGGLKADLSKK